MNIHQTLSQSPLDRLEVEVLLAYTLQVERVYLHTYPEKILSKTEIDQFVAYEKRRLQGEPLAYIVGEKEFWSLRLKVTKNTLIPRPETELLIENTINNFKNSIKCYFLELATGCGAISMALAKAFPQSHFLATDISEKALKIAKENQQVHHLSNIEFVQSDWFSALNPTLKFDVIISNPPYIAEDDPHLTQGDLRYEPKIALTPGKTGLEAITQIIFQAKSWLVPSGWIFLEHGFDQAKQVMQLFRENGYSHITTKKDLNHHARVTFATISDVQLRFSSKSGE